jgi:hypothetical protein
MPKKGYESVTIRTKTKDTLNQISEQIGKSVPDTITILADLFSRYVGFLKALKGETPPTTDDLISLVEQLKITTAGEPSRVEASEKVEAQTEGV